MLVIRTTDM